jgi:hypothetical protein
MAGYWQIQKLSDLGIDALVGGESDKAFLEMDNVINYPYTITVGKNALSVGPLTQNAEITIPDGSAWAII